MASALMTGPGLIPPTIVSSVATSTPITKTVKDQVKEYFRENPIMVKIAWCESRFRQYDKGGEIFRGVVNDRDIGVMQINTDYHSKTATKMQIDLTTTEGNMAYAKYLYDKQGTAPWSSSSACWKDEIAMK